MSISDSPLIDKIQHTYNINLGMLYIIDNLLITEYNPHLHIRFKDCDELIAICDKHFGSKPFGCVANRINPYSLELTDYKKYLEAFPNLHAYGIVCYSNLAKNNAELEILFFRNKRYIYSELMTAVNQISELMKIGIA